MMKSNMEDILKNILEKKQDLEYRSNHTIQSMYDIANESSRVANYAKNVKQELNNISIEFENQTGLSEQDTLFLMVAIAMQSLRWILLPKLGRGIDPSTRFEHDAKEIKGSIKSDNNSFKKQFTDKNGKLNVIQSEKGYKTWTDILFNGAPYDITKGSPMAGINMEGKYHRYKTLGHDPLLGWIFGTANFMTDTITLNDFTSYKIREKQFTNEIIPIPQLFYEVIDSIVEDKIRLPAAIFAQGVHLASDKYTKLGLPIPLLGVFSESFAGELYREQYDSICFTKDLKNIGQSAIVSILINMLIGLIHGLFYNEEQDKQRKLYEVRTRKIITYSNLFASSSNVLYVAINASMGRVDSLKKLDLGGFMVTLYRVINDSLFIEKLKEEFILKNFISKIHNKNGEYILK